MNDDLKERLSRLADRATDQGDALERLHRRRARKDRSRRLGTVALALTVAVAGSWGAFAALAGRDDERTAVGDQSPSGVAAWQPPEVLTVWPENPVRGPSPDDVQAAVDAGDESLVWRLDPNQVADRFARTVLAWDPKFMLSVAKERGTARGVMSPCGDAEYCAMLPADYQASQIRLVQPIRRGEGGIWSVASFTSHGLQIDLPLGDPGGALTGGTEIELSVELDEARSAHIGLVSRNGCSEAASLEPGLGSGRHTITVPEPEPAAETDPSCGLVGAGFVFAYAQDDTTIPVGDPLLEPAAIEYPWLTIIPLYVEMIRDDIAPATPA